MKKWLFLCLVVLLSGCQAATHSNVSAQKSTQKPTETTTASAETSTTEPVQKTTTPTLFYSWLSRRSRIIWRDDTAFCPKRLGEQ